MSYLYKEEERVKGRGGSEVEEENNHHQCQPQENRQQDGEEGQGVAAVPTGLGTKEERETKCEKSSHSNHGYNTQARYEPSCGSHRLFCRRLAICGFSKYSLRASHILHSKDSIHKHRTLSHSQ